MHRWQLRLLELCSACKVLGTNVLSLMGHFRASGWPALDDFSQGSFLSQSHGCDSDPCKLVLKTQTLRIVEEAL